MFWYLLNKLFPTLRGKLRNARLEELKHRRFVKAARTLAKKG